MDMSAILISEFISSQALETLKAHHQVDYRPELYQDLDALRISLAKADGFIVRNLTKVNADLLKNADRLKVVGRLGVGLENIDLQTCAQKKIAVIPATGANADSVAEYVIGTSIALMRGFASASSETLAGTWPRLTFSSRHELADRVLGIVGFGSIGRIVAQKAIAMKMKCIAFDPAIQESHIELGTHAVPILSLHQVLQQSDVITLHLPFLPETKNLFNATTLDLMKAGAYLINTARGKIVDEIALAERLQSGRLGGAALDVFANEPAKDLNHFKGIPNLILTPHIAGVTTESNERVSLMIAREVNSFLESRT
jgi:(S)-sulfolactate dehydrogenase